MTRDERGNAALSLPELRNQAHTKGQPSLPGISDKAITGLLIALAVSPLHHTGCGLSAGGKLKMELLTGGRVAEPMLIVRSGPNPQWKMVGKC